jgi:hypothetical protein
MTTQIPAFLHLLPSLQVCLAHPCNCLDDPSNLDDLAALSRVCPPYDRDCGQGITELTKVLSCSRDKIVWECENGGQLWGNTANTTLGTGHLPSAICAPGWQSLFTAFIVSLLVDVGCQVCHSCGCRCVLLTQSSALHAVSQLAILQARRALPEYERPDGWRLVPSFR